MTTEEEKISLLPKNLDLKFCDDKSKRIYSETFNIMNERTVSKKI